MLKDEPFQSINPTEAVEAIVNIFCDGIMAKPVERENVNERD